MEIKRIVKRHGLPKISEVGRNGARAAWLLTQHCDSDPRFQRHCLKLMKRAAEEGEAELRYVAFLTDRVRVNANKPQLYGTQFRTNKRGRMAPRPIEDRRNLDKRRARMHLGRFAAYEKDINKKLGVGQ